MEHHRTILARDIMTRSVITVSMDMDLQGAALVFTSHQITGAPVVDGDHMLVGVLSARDIMRHAARGVGESDHGSAQLSRDELATLAELRHDFEAQRGTRLKVMDVMTPYAVSAGEETPAVELAQIMCREKVHRILILDQGRLTGIVSSMDIVRAVASSSLGSALKGRGGAPPRRSGDRSRRPGRLDAPPPAKSRSRGRGNHPGRR
jgi:CBS-domain-containing membrane protein